MVYTQSSIIKQLVKFLLILPSDINHEIPKAESTITLQYQRTFCVYMRSLHPIFTVFWDARKYYIANTSTDAI